MHKKMTWSSLMPKFSQEGSKDIYFVFYDICIIFYVFYKFIL
jgi:hypothetical protein